MHLAGVLRHPAVLGERPSEKEFDLGIGTSEVVGGPAGKSVVHRRVQPKKDLLPL